MEKLYEYIRIQSAENSIEFIEIHNIWDKLEAKKYLLFFYQNCILTESVL